MSTHFNATTANLPAAGVGAWLMRTFAAGAWGRDRGISKDLKAAAHTAARAPVDASVSDIEALADTALRVRVLARLSQRSDWHGETSNLHVADGVVVYQGLFSRESQRLATLAIARGTPGVRAVRDERVRSREWQAMA